MTSDTTPQNEWVQPPTAAEDLQSMTSADELSSPGTAGGTSRRLKAAGIVATAVVVGFVGVLAVQGSSATPSASTGPGGPRVGPAGQLQQGGPRGGFADRGVHGTIQAVSSSSLTVAGTTVQLTSATQVLVNGTVGSVADLKKGDTVFVHTEGSGSSRWAERVFVGGLPAGGPGFGPPPGQTEQDGGAADHT